MKKLILPIMAAGLLTLTGCVSDSSSSSVDNLTNAANIAKNASQSASLISSLTDSLGVTPTQAAGGTAALLGYAGTQLTGTNSDELSSLTSKLGATSGLDSLSTAGESLNSLTALNNAFEELGLSSEIISEYTPIILKTLSESGASSSLLSSLSSLWAI